MANLGYQFDYNRQIKRTQLSTPVKSFLDWIIQGEKTHPKSGSFEVRR